MLYFAYLWATELLWLINNTQPLFIKLTCPPKSQVRNVTGPLAHFSPMTISLMSIPTVDRVPPSCLFPVADLSILWLKCWKIYSFVFLKNYSLKGYKYFLFFHLILQNILCFGCIKSSTLKIVFFWGFWGDKHSFLARFSYSDSFDQLINQSINQSLNQSFKQTWDHITFLRRFQAVNKGKQIYHHTNKKILNIISESSPKFHCVILSFEEVKTGLMKHLLRFRTSVIMVPWS